MLNRCFPTSHTHDWWNWKYDENVFGRSILLVAEEDKQIVGLRSFWRWDFLYKGEIIKAVQAVDTCVDHSYRRKGIFTKLLVEALEIAKSQGCQIVYNFPGGLSLPGYMKLDWKYIKKIGWYIKLLKPLKIFMNYLTRKKENVRYPIKLNKKSHVLLSEINQFPISQNKMKIGTLISQQFYNWRYIKRPDVNYGIINEQNINGQNIGIYRLNNCRSLCEFMLIDVINFEEKTAENFVWDMISTAKNLGSDYIMVSELIEPKLGKIITNHNFFYTQRKHLNFVAKGIKMDKYILDFKNWDISLGEIDMF